MLIGWKQCSANKWNRFNSQQIEYKSSCQVEGTDESLIRSDSFVIDDSFGTKLIDDFGLDEHVMEQCNVKIDIKPKKATMDKGSVVNMHKTKKISDRFGRKCDQYSEKRCLTADDEQFDFALQACE